MPGDELITVTVERIDADALGVARSGEHELIINGAAPGDRVKVRIDHKSPHRPVAWASVAEVISRGPMFLEPSCPHAWPVRGSCGGCPALHLVPEAQRSMKVQHVCDALARENITAAVEYSSSPNTLGYRNRGQFVPGRDLHGQVFLGSYAPRSHQVAPMAGCPVLRAPIPRLTADIARLINRDDIPIHPKNDALRYVTLRASYSGEVLADLVVNGPSPSWLGSFFNHLMTLESVVGLSMSVNQEKGNAIHTGPSILLAGQETIEDPVGPLKLMMTATGFSQLNSEVAAAMYERARQQANKAEVIWDLYCGLGGLGLTVALGRKGRLFGSDAVEASIALARENARQALADTHYEPLDLSSRLPEGWPDPEIVLVNPPRRGLDRLVLQRLQSIGAKGIIYMSCNPTTFARDAKALGDGGWKTGKVYAHDMLPGTTHVELVAAFER